MYMYTYIHSHSGIREEAENAREAEAGFDFEGTRALLTLIIYIYADFPSAPRIAM